MRCGTRRYSHATLSVALPHALPARMQSTVRELLGVAVPEAHRRQGLASELLTRTVKEARRQRTVLLLTIEEAWLEAFYARFGFVAIQREPKVLMVRPLETTP